jgi:hypothetical protein
VPDLCENAKGRIGRMIAALSANLKSKTRLTVGRARVINKNRCPASAGLLQCFQSGS